MAETSSCPCGGGAPCGSKDDFFKAFSENNVVAWIAYRGSGITTALTELIRKLAAEMPEDEVVVIMDAQSRHNLADVVATLPRGVTYTPSGTCLEVCDCFPAGTPVVVWGKPIFRAPPGNRHIGADMYFLANTNPKLPYRGIYVGRDEVLRVMSDFADAE